MKQSYVILLLLCSYGEIYARQLEPNGYVVLNSNDTLVGRIHYDKTSFNPDSIKFFLANAIEPVTYYPTDISYFQLYENNGKKSPKYQYEAFLAAKVILQPYKLFSKLKERNVFLRILTKGSRLSLLEYVYKKDPIFFIQDGSKKIVNLSDSRACESNTVYLLSCYQRDLYSYCQPLDKDHKLNWLLSTVRYNSDELSFTVLNINNWMEYIPKEEQLHPLIYILGQALARHIYACGLV